MRTDNSYAYATARTVSQRTNQNQPGIQVKDATTVNVGKARIGPYLFHDTRLPLGEGDVATRLILNELDFDLSALATGLFLVFLVVTHATLGGAVVSSAVTGGLLQLVLGRGRVLLTDGSDVGHGGMREREREGEKWGSLVVRIR